MYTAASREIQPTMKGTRMEDDFQDLEAEAEAEAARAYATRMRPHVIVIQPAQSIDSSKEGLSARSEGTHR